jgi:hypothetical protein
LRKLCATSAPTGPPPGKKGAGPTSRRLSRGPLRPAAVERDTTFSVVDEKTSRSWLGDFPLATVNWYGWVRNLYSTRLPQWLRPFVLIGGNFQLYAMSLPVVCCRARVVLLHRLIQNCSVLPLALRHHLMLLCKEKNRKRSWVKRRSCGKRKGRKRKRKRKKNKGKGNRREIRKIEIVIHKLYYLYYIGQ